MKFWREMAGKATLLRSGRLVEEGGEPVRRVAIVIIVIDAPWMAMICSVSKY